MKQIILPKISVRNIIAVWFFTTIIWALFAFADYPPTAERVTNVFAQTELTLPDEVSVGGLYPTVGGIFVSDLNERLWRLELDGGFAEIPLGLSDNERLIDVDAGSDGEPILLTFIREPESGEEHYILSQSEGGDRRVICGDTARLVGGGDITDLALDRDRNIYLSVKNTVYIFDASLNPQFEIRLPSRVEALRTDDRGRVLASYADAGNRMSASVIDYRSGTLGESITTPDLKKFENARVRFASLGEAGSSGTSSDDVGFEYYLDTSTGLFGVKVGDEPELLCDWVNSDVIRGAVSELVVLSSRRLLYRSVDGLYLLDRADDREVPKKYIIKVAVRYADTSVASRLVSFNRQSDKYRAVLVEYGGDNTSTDSGIAELRISADMHTRNSPDVIALCDFSLADEWVKNNALLELSPALYEGIGVSDGDFVNGILDIFSYNGQLFELPERFTLSTLLGKRESLPSESWDLTEFLEFAASLPEGSVLCESGLGLSELLPFSLDRFVSMKGGRADFSKNGFTELLRLLNETQVGSRYEDTISGDELADYRMGGRASLLYEDRVLLSRIDFGNIADFVAETVRFGGSEVSAVGYPTDSGNGVLVTARSSWGITVKSRVQDGAFELISHLIKHGSGDGFSAYEDSFAAECERECERGYFFSYGGSISSFDKGSEATDFGSNGLLRELTREDVEYVRSLLRGARRLGVHDNGIMAIVNEEVSAYFAGAKSLDATLGVINDRAGTYARENAIYTKRY